MRRNQFGDLVGIGRVRETVRKLAASRTGREVIHGGSCLERTGCARIFEKRAKIRPCRHNGGKVLSSRSGHEQRPAKTYPVGNLQTTVPPSRAKHERRCRLTLSKLDINAATATVALRQLRRAVATLIRERRADHRPSR